MESTPQARRFPAGEGKRCKSGRMAMAFKATADSNWHCDAFSAKNWPSMGNAGPDPTSDLSLRFEKVHDPLPE